jgi:periplasmic protein TonB
MRPYRFLPIVAWTLASVFLCGQQAGSDAGSSAPAAKPDPSRPLRARVSEGVAKKLLLKRVAPAYPEEALRNKIQGDVVLKVQIDTNGAVKDVSFESGPAELTSVSIDAVKQWKYKPYLLDGKPVELETKVTVSFELAGQ